MSPVSLTRICASFPIILALAYVTGASAVAGPARNNRPSITVADEKGQTMTSASPSNASQTFDVTVSPGGALSFSPSTVDIVAGDTVRWTWDGIGHNVRS